MKRKFTTIAILLGLAAAAKADLFFVGDEITESLPISWSVGANLIYDDNVLPGGPRDGEDSLAINPFVGATWASVTPQTTIDIYARLGGIFYFDAPDGADDAYMQSRLGVNVTHRFSERLRWVSRNFISYELEPDYSFGYANTRLSEEYLFWSVDNALGYRWTERFATYTGFRLNGVDYRGDDQGDRFIWTIYNQFRYQLTPQTVLTAEYRYSETDASSAARDSTNQYFLAGVEHRFSPTTIGILRVGAQHRDVDGGDTNTSPYLEAALNSQINQQLRVRAFARYGLESFDTVRADKVNPGIVYDFDERQTFRLGLSGDYAISPTLTVYGGIDYIPAKYDGGVLYGTNTQVGGSFDDEIFNIHAGVQMKFTDYLYGTLSYTYTDSSSDLFGRDYDRSRVSLGMRAEF